MGAFFSYLIHFLMELSLTPYFLPVPL